MRLRSQVPVEDKEVESIHDKKRKKRLEIDANPPIEYKGKVTYHTTLIDCAISCDYILEKVKATDKIFPIGFDLEWPFNFQTGPGKVAVIQMSISLEECFVLHVSTIKNLPKAFTQLIIQPNVRLVGVNIKNDIRKLARDFHGVDADTVIERCIDASGQANAVLNCRRRWSMADLVEEFLETRISKDKKVRMSKWHVIPLSQEQQVYAATDAYVSLKLHLQLEMLRDVAEKENMEINKEALK